MTAERNPAPSLRGPNPFRIGPKQSRGLGSGGPRGRTLRWARRAAEREAWPRATPRPPSGRLRAASALEYRNDGIVCLLTRLDDRERYPRSSATRDQRLVASDPSQHPAPLHLGSKCRPEKPPATTGLARIIHLRHPGESRGPARIEKCPKWAAFEWVSQQEPTEMRSDQATPRGVLDHPGQVRCNATYAFPQLHP